MNDHGKCLQIHCSKRLRGRCLKFSGFVDGKCAYCGCPASAHEQPDNISDYKHSLCCMELHRNYLKEPAIDMPVIVLSDKMVTFRLDDIPEYLHSSGYFLSLDLDDEGEIELPDKYFKSTLKLSSLNDLTQLFSTLRFWDSEEVLRAVVRFVYHNSHIVGMREFLYNANMAYTDVLYEIAYVPKLKRKNALGVEIVLETPTRCYVSSAIKSGVIEILQFVNEELGHEFTDVEAYSSICEGRLECLQYIVQCGVALDEFWWRDCIRYNDVPMLRYFLTAKDIHTLTVDFTLFAAFVGNLPCLRYLREVKNCPWDAETCSHAAWKGHLDCLMYAHRHGCPWDIKTCVKAAEGGALMCLRYAHEHGAPWDASVCAAAAEFKQVQCLAYLIENGCPADETVANFALANGDIELLMLAHENLVPWDDDMCMLAAQKGDLRCLKYVHQAGCPLTLDTAIAAAGGGHLPCLQYLHENGGPWSASVCVAAAKVGSLECLSYSYSHGCPVNQQVSMAAIVDKYKWPEILRYAGENKFPWSAELTQYAALSDSLPCLKVLFEFGCPMSDATITRAASQAGSTDCLIFALQRGCPCDPVPCVGLYSEDHYFCLRAAHVLRDLPIDLVEAITADHFECFLLAHHRGVPWSKSVVVCAAQYGRLKYLQYIFNHGGGLCINFVRAGLKTARRYRQKSCVNYFYSLLRRRKWLPTMTEIDFSLLASAISSDPRLESCRRLCQGIVDAFPPIIS